MIDEIKKAISPDCVWHDTIQFFETITSTNDVLKQMAQKGAPEGTVLVADCQTGGRGRLGRTFLSPPDLGIYMSVLLRPQCAAGELMHLTCAAAVAACNAIEKTVGIRPGIKWTNDLVYEKKKLSGILTELGLGKSAAVDYAIIGIGVNCNQAIEDFPSEINQIAGSLKMFVGDRINRAFLAANMVNAFYSMNQDLLTEKSRILQEYKNDCITLGQEVSVVQGDSIRHGKAQDIDAEGGLVVQFENGVTETVSSGEVSVRGLYHYI